VTPEEYRAAFVDELRVAGALESPEWEVAFRRVPRHRFVPRIVGCWPPDEEGRSERFVLGPEVDRERWLRLVYSDRLLVTVDEDERWSSSSRPRVMIRFLEGLHVVEGNTVLEIGTGTGYNAALLCERLGSERVTSIDIDAELVALARERLLACGYAPALAVADGSEGYLPRAPYDRIVATYSVARIPDAWLDQLAPGGIIVAPLAGGRFEAVGLVRLVARPDGSFHGAFHPAGASFIPLRRPGAAPVSEEELAALVERGEGETRACRIPEWLSGGPERVRVTSHGQGLEPNFLLRLEIPELRWFWLDGGLPAIACAIDRSWARVRIGSGGVPVVAQGGPRRLWDVVERSWERYLRLGRPGMGRYGLTITPDRRQSVWLDHPGSEHRWEL